MKKMPLILIVLIFAFLIGYLTLILLGKSSPTLQTQPSQTGLMPEEGVVEPGPVDINKELESFDNLMDEVNNQDFAPETLSDIEE